VGRCKNKDEQMKIGRDDDEYKHQIQKEKVMDRASKCKWEEVTKKTSNTHGKRRLKK